MENHVQIMTNGYFSKMHPIFMQRRAPAKANWNAAENLHNGRFLYILDAVALLLPLNNGAILRY